MLRVLVTWEEPEEIETAIKVRRWIDECLDQHGCHAGEHTVNLPQGSVGMNLPDTVRDAQ